MNRAEEFSLKVESVRIWLAKEGHEAALFRSQSGFAWITAGGRSHISIGEETGVAAVLVTLDHAYLITTNIELERLLDEETTDLPFEHVAHTWHRISGDRKTLTGLCDPDRTVTDVNAKDLAHGGSGLIELRHTLLTAEQDRYRRLGRHAAEAVEATCRAAQPDDTEHDIAGHLADQCVQRDILPLVVLVAADDRIAAYRHPLPTSNRLRRTVLVALTGRRYGLHASLTRMVSFGLPDLDLADRHRAVTRVDAGLILASAPGSQLGGVMREGMQQYAEEGFPGEWERHHQGGVTGYAGREVFAKPGSPYRLLTDQAVAWNPSITRVKSEDTVLLTAAGPEVLTDSGAWPSTEVSVDTGAIRRPSMLVSNC